MKRIKFTIVLGILLLCLLGNAQNPIIRDLFTADPAALVHNDRVYIYTGHDIAAANATFFDMRDWYVFHPPIWSTGPIMEQV